MSAVASSSTRPLAAMTKLVLTPVKNLEGHEKVRRNLPDGEQCSVLHVSSISYFPDGKQMISGSADKTARRWDLHVGKEIEKVRHVCEHDVWAVAVSKDGRWIVTAGGDVDNGELKACEVETGIVRTFHGHSRWISCVDISADSTMLASGADDSTARIWCLDTGKLVAGPFESADMLGAVRLSHDLKKLAIKSDVGKCLEVWDVDTQTLDIRVGSPTSGAGTFAPVFWTTQDKTIIAACSFKDEAADEEESDEPMTIYEFDPSTLETVGAPFEGHTNVICGLALSFDGILLASASKDDTINLWAFESRQLLASFDVKKPSRIIISPDSCQLAYTTWDDTNIYICNTPSGVLASICRPNASAPHNPCIVDLLNSNATRPPVSRRNPVISPAIYPIPRLPPMHPRQPAVLRYLRKLLPSRSRTAAVRVLLSDEPRDPLDSSAALSLPPNYSPSTTQGNSDIDSRENVSALLARLSSLLHRFRHDNAEVAECPQPSTPSGLHPQVLFARLSSLLPRSRLNTEDETEPHPTTHSGSRPDALIGRLSSLFRSQPHTNEEMELPQRSWRPHVVEVAPMRDREVLFVTQRSPPDRPHTPPNGTATAYPLPLRLLAHLVLFLCCAYPQHAAGNAQPTQQQQQDQSQTQAPSLQPQPAAPSTSATPSALDTRTTAPGAASV